MSACDFRSTLHILNYAVDDKTFMQRKMKDYIQKKFWKLKLLTKNRIKILEILAGN